MAQVAEALSDASAGGSVEGVGRGRGARRGVDSSGVRRTTEAVR